MSKGKDKKFKIAKHQYKQIMHEGYFQSLSEFIFEMNIDCQMFFDQLLNNYSQHVISRTERSSDFFLEAGFPISLSRKVLSGEKIQKQNIIESFFQDVVEIVKEYADQSSDMTVKIKSRGRCFNKAFYSLNNPSNSITAKSMISQMIKRGIVELVDENTLKFLTAIPSEQCNTVDQVTHVYGHVTQRLTHTLIRNKKSKCDDERDFQQTYRSIHIHPDDHEVARHKFKKLLRKQWLEIENLMDSLEVKTEFEKRNVEKLNTEFGVSSFVYSINPNEE